MPTTSRGPSTQASAASNSSARPLARAHRDPDRRLAERVEVGAVVADVQQVVDPPAAAQPLDGRALVDRDRRAHLEHHPADAPGQPRPVELRRDLRLQVPLGVRGARRVAEVDGEGDALVLDPAPVLGDQPVVLDQHERLADLLTVLRGLRDHDDLITLHHLEPMVARDGDALDRHQSAALRRGAAGHAGDERVTGAQCLQHANVPDGTLACSGVATIGASVPSMSRTTADRRGSASIGARSFRRSSFSLGIPATGLQ